MSLLSLHGVSLAFGGAPLLDAISLDIHKGQRVCILGRNGAGKSTLMKVIAGIRTPDSGQVVAASGITISYLPQDVPENLDGTVYDIVAARAGRIGQFLIHHRHAADEPELHHVLDEENGWAVNTAIQRVCQNLCIDPAADVARLSGGMRRRVLLAGALVCEPELLLLDEPTNHLDIESISRLENYILNSRTTLMFVTHDRRLLRAIATRIIEVDRGHIVDWSCDYETFLSRKEAVLDAEEKQRERFDKKLAQEEVWIRRGIKARRTRNMGRVGKLKDMREQRRKRRERSGTVSMEISEAHRSGEMVLQADSIGFGHGVSAVISGFSMTISRGDRIGIIGPNGCGKSTLLRLLLGYLHPDSGTIRTGTGVQVSYFDQLREILDPEKTVWENVAPGGTDTVIVNSTPRHVISYLQDFLFPPDRARTPVNQLSGGERNRLMLARLFARPANLLVFDEPTNDLDAETLELLEELLNDYRGTILVVSHDREFLNNIVTSILAYEGLGNFKEYIGGYDDWERQRTPIQRPTADKQTEPAPRSTLAHTPGQKKLTYRENQELEQLPGRIDALEREYESITAQMADTASAADPIFLKSARERIPRIEAELEKCYSRWEELESRKG